MKLNRLKSINSFINELKQKDKFVVSYSGKFQPFHYGHYDIYKQLIKKFGKENVYITTADLNQTNIGKPEYDFDHILSFDEKKLIMTKIFNIPASNIKMVKNTYAPRELTSMFPTDTAFITVLGSKDADRLSKGRKYFKMYSDVNDMKGYMEYGYIWAQDNSPGINMSATEIREMFRSNIDIKDKETAFKKYYGGKFDAAIFNMLNTKLNNNYTNENEDNRFSLCAHSVQTNEGGAFGHLEHIYDDYKLSFAQLKELVNLTLSGKLENAVEKCVHEDTEIILEKHGRMKIKNVVDNMIIDKVLSYDHTTNEIKFNDILDYASNGEECEWLEIATENNKVLVTANHRVFVDGIGDIKAEDLTEDMIIINL